jgi:hypothetical protein
LSSATKDVRQHFVGTVADKDLLRPDAEVGVAGGNRLLEAIGVRVRVEAQRPPTVRQFVGNCRQDLRCRRGIGIFVGVQLDEIRQLRLLARNVRRQAMNEGTPVAAHERLVRSGARQALKWYHARLLIQSIC